MKTSITTIDLLRHGEVEGREVYRGVTDDPLTDAGWQQMVSTLDGKSDWDIVISSPLQCCSEFAELIASEDDIELDINDQLKEIDYGLWDGLPPNEILKSDAELLHQWSLSPTTITPPDGEDYHLFQGRILAAFKNLIEENQGQRILLISHAGVIRIILMHILGMPNEKLFSLPVAYGSLSKLQIHHDETGQWACLVEYK